MARYDFVTDEMFDRFEAFFEAVEQAGYTRTHLIRMVGEMSGEQMMAIAGVYEHMKEELNNAVIDACEAENDALREAEQVSTEELEAANDILNRAVGLAEASPEPSDCDPPIPTAEELTQPLDLATEAQGLIEWIYGRLLIDDGIDCATLGLRVALHQAAQQMDGVATELASFGDEDQSDLNDHIDSLFDAAQEQQDADDDPSDGACMTCDGAGCPDCQGSGEEYDGQPDDLQEHSDFAQDDLPEASEMIGADE